MMLDTNKIKENLSNDTVISLMKDFGVEKYLETDSAIIFPTICHNIDLEKASMKLYYYKDSKIFHCYTECAESFDIYGLFKKVLTLQGKETNFYSDILIPITKGKNISSYEFDSFKYESVRDKYKKKSKNIDLKSYNKGVLEVFTNFFPVEWQEEGITQESMDKYNIRYSLLRNKIIIPHYDIEGNLVGIRGRALNENEVKYLPVEIEQITYSHPLSLNLYGINLAKEAINKEKKIILFEGEKSVLKFNSLFENNNSLAVCGSSFNKSQLDLIRRNFQINEIVIAFDKEYEEYNSKEGQKYFLKLFNLCEKYKNYYNFSFIFDKEKLIKRKDSPIDRGKEVFLRLFNKRVKLKT